MTHSAKRIVITGANGFIGAALAHHFAAGGAEVVGFVRPDSELWRLDDVSLMLHTGDIRKPATLAGVFTGADWVIHTAGKLGEAGVPEEAYYDVHVNGTRNVLQAVSAESPSARVLHISSPGVLGPLLGISPTRFPDEATPIAPSNPYERTKAVGEWVAQQFAASGLDVVIVRPEFVYGPGDVHVLGLFKMIERGLFFYIGDGDNWCHPSYIDDVVRGMALALERGRSGEIYHITGERPQRWRAFAEAIASALDVKPPRIHVPRALVLAGAVAGEGLGKFIGRKPPLSRTGVDFFSENRGTSCVKARVELGYTPEIDIITGIRRAVAWYRERGLL
ncbi:MAG: NAD-dependent epimerase/dehydratase family protein [Anaerolineae bacterium]|nr:NAD-dependent epimerase/dehydratase family protein [Anaerolineae bacterium]